MALSEQNLLQASLASTRQKYLLDQYGWEHFQI